MTGRCPQHVALRPAVLYQTAAPSSEEDAVPEQPQAPSSDAPPEGVAVGVPLETLAGETRVALSPNVIGALSKLGARVVVEAGAGEAAGFPDAAYTDKGASIGDRDAAFAADVLVAVRLMDGDPEHPDLKRLRSGQVVVGMAIPLARPELVAAVAERGATLFALELLPRLTRAQGMDVLSSQANVAGYKAVLLAAEALPRMFPLLTTAAGTIAPARVFIVGAGVAGLSAIATSRRLGAVVEAYDVRPAVKEEVESLGARFVELPRDEDEESADSGSGAYAKAQSEEDLARQRELMAKTVAGSDVVITTAQVQGARAPMIVSADMVAGMAPGSVIVDLAAEQGGNCELSEPGQTVDTGGVRVIGPENLPASVPYHASLTYGKNVANFLGLIVSKGALAIDLEDAVVRDTMACQAGEVTHPRVRDALGLAPLEPPEAEAEPEPEPEASTEAEAPADTESEVAR